MKKGSVVRLTRQTSWWGKRIGVEGPRIKYPIGTLFIVNEFRADTGYIKNVSPILDRDLKIPNVGYLHDGVLESL